MLFLHDFFISHITSAVIIVTAEADDASIQPHGLQRKSAI